MSVSDEALVAAVYDVLAAPAPALVPTTRAYAPSLVPLEEETTILEADKTLNPKP